MSEWKVTIYKPAGMPTCLRHTHVVTYLYLCIVYVEKIHITINGWRFGVFVPLTIEPTSHNNGCFDCLFYIY